MRAPKAFHLFTAVVGAMPILVQLSISWSRDLSIVGFFSFFTVQSNILACDPTGTGRCGGSRGWTR